MDRGSCDGINYLEEEKRYAVKYAERRAVRIKVLDKYCPSVSDDLRRKILYRPYLSLQRGPAL
jgi:hypothetical protein